MENSYGQAVQKKAKMGQIWPEKGQTGNPAQYSFPIAQPPFLLFQDGIPGHAAYILLQSDISYAQQGQTHYYHKCKNGLDQGRGLYSFPTVQPPFFIFQDGTPNGGMCSNASFVF